MYKEEKSYLELKVTLSHVLILIVSLIAIGGFLFYLGYSAGKNSGISSGKLKSSDDPLFPKNEILKIEDVTSGKDIKKKKNKNPKKSDSIDRELNNFKKNNDLVKNSSQKKRVIKRKNYYTIQVGSFVSHKLAKNFAAKFSSKGYQTDILQVNLSGRLWFRVRVGSYKTLSEAKKGKKELGKLEKGKFSIVRSN